MGLEEYRRKRSFSDTPEPRGGNAVPGGKPRFVVQEHHARRVHWDLRLEMDGVFRSWALPKGPSLDPAEKRLAVLVEDHPLEYGGFEGIIPPGNYGAGTVMLWDRGAYECREGDPAEAFRRGKLTLRLAGEKLRGEFHFVRTTRNEGRDWLLFKGHDEFAVAGFSPLGTRSVESGRTITEIGAEKDARWLASRPEPPRSAGAAPTNVSPGAGATATARVEASSSSAPSPEVGAASEGGPPARTRRPARARPSARSQPSSGKAPSPAAAVSREPARRRTARSRAAAQDPFPGPFPPMLAQSAPGPFSREGWYFEIKWDGVRTLGFVRRRGPATEVVLYSRTSRRLNAQFPEIVDALAELPCESAVLDGEIFAPDEQGRPDFARLQQRINLSREGDVREAAARISVFYAVFDCLYLDGRDLRSRPLAERRRALEGIALPAGVLRADAMEGAGLTLFQAAREHGLEGIIAKRAASPYRPGVRSADWQKIKVRQTLEAVVGGMTRGKGHRIGTFGALILGQYDPATGALIHIGQTGGGLKDEDLRILRKRLDPLVIKTSPFAGSPKTLQPATWVRPEVVVEVEYSEFTPDGMLRAPVFLRVRDDIQPSEVRWLPGQGAHSEEGVTASAEAVASAGAAGPPPPQVERAVQPAAAPGSRAALPGRPGRSRGGRAAAQVAFTNLDKVFFPELGLTKGDVIDYYRRIAPYILPHLRDRPLTLRRWPDGITGSDFFQKDVDGAPSFVRIERVWSADSGRDLRLVVCDNEPTLLWLAQLGCIEMHAWFSCTTPVRGRGRRRPGTTFSGSEHAIETSTLNYPDVVLFDIDPFLFPEGSGPTKRHGEYDPDFTRRGFEAARTAALALGEALDGLGLRSFLKTSGKTGLHVFIPIVREYTYEQTHAFAKTLTTWLTAQHPDLLTTAWAVRDRVGRVFLDYNQNARGKTLASVYSLRPVPEATVSVPVAWEELRAGLDPLAWTIATVFDRLERVGDLWAGILEAAQELGSSAGR